MGLRLESPGNTPVNQVCETVSKMFNVKKADVTMDDTIL